MIEWLILGLVLGYLAGQSSGRRYRGGCYRPAQPTKLPSGPVPLPPPTGGTGTVRKRAAGMAREEG